jgi:hypothetical protein
MLSGNRKLRSIISSSRGTCRELLVMCYLAGVPTG